MNLSTLNLTLPRHIRAYSLLVLVLPISCMLLTSCGASKATISGKVEEVLHHGAYSPNNRNKTISPLGNVRLIISDTLGTAVDTTLTSSDGSFMLQVTEGTYMLASQERSNELGPGSSPSPQRIVVRGGDTAVVLFRYQVYAP